MESVAESAQELIKYQEINEQVRKIIRLQQQIEMKMIENQYLNLTNNEIRAILENKVLSQPACQGLPTRMIECIRYEIQIRLDLLLPLSIGNYRSDNWKDPHLLLDYIYQKLQVISGEKRWNFKSFKDLKEEYKTKIISNQKLLATNPITEAEVRDFQKRLIYFKSGGINNIKNIIVIELPLVIEDTVRNQKFLAVQVKNPSDCRSDHIYDANWQEACSFENIHYHFPLQKGSFIKRPGELGMPSAPAIFKLKKLTDNKLKTEKMLLFLIKNDDTDLITINTFIDDWKKESLSLESKAIRTFVINQFKNAKIQEFYNDFESKALELSLLQNDLVSLQNNVEAMIIKTKVFNSKITELELQITAVLDHVIDLIKIETKNGSVSVNKTLVAELKQKRLKIKLANYEARNHQTTKSVEKEVLSNQITELKQRLIMIQLQEKHVIAEFIKVQIQEFKNQQPKTLSKTTTFQNQGAISKQAAVTKVPTNSELKNKLENLKSIQKQVNTEAKKANEEEATLLKTSKHQNRHKTLKE